MLQHDDQLEDIAHGVWVHFFGEDNDDVLPSNYSKSLLSLMDHDHENVRTMSSIALSNALEIYPNTATETLNHLFSLYHTMNSKNIDLSKYDTSSSSSSLKGDKFEKFYNNSAQDSMMTSIKLKRSLCRVEVARALGESSELDILEETHVMSIFEFLLDDGLVDENESVQLQMTEAGMSMCNAYGKNMNSVLLPMFESRR
jgi:hypothetical protein